MSPQRHLRIIRLCLGLVIAGLLLSGLTAFPLQTEVAWLKSALQHPLLSSSAQRTGLLPWIDRVNEGLSAMSTEFPFLAYGTDWLAFAHLVIAIAFIGPYRDPVRNRWVITFGLIACTGVLPLALIAGHVRGIPVGWRLIDCSFAVLCAIPLLVCRRHLDRLEQTPSQTNVAVPAVTGT